MELGIVKWYGGFNQKKNQENKFGFITRAESEEDVFVHESGLTCRPEEMVEDTVVAFELRENERTGKAQAVNVRVIDFQQVEDVKLCLQSNHSSIWEKGFAELFFLQHSRIDDGLANIIYEKLQQLNESDINYALSCIPNQVFYDYEMIRQFLNINDRLKFTIELYEKSTNTDEKDTYFQQMKEWVVNDHESIQMQILEKLPEELMVLDEVWEFVPVSKKVEILIKQIESKNDRDVNILQKLKSYLNDRYIAKLPESIKRDPIIFPVLSSIGQVEIAWENVASYWNIMSRNAKIMAIYRAVKERNNVFSFMTANEEKDALVRIILHLVKNEQNMPLPQLFYTFQTNITNYINELIKTLPSNKTIDLRPLLPSCPFQSDGIFHCEGKRWRTPEGNWKEDDFGQELAFCPRIYRACNVKTVEEPAGCHIHPVTELGWEHWTLVELFAAIGIQPESYISMRIDERYVLKLAGWVNRINDIKERLFCFDCKTPLEPHLAYSKKFARYNITVAHCPDCSRNTYFNHCWNCSHIIDSRQSKVMYRNYYICIACGSGPQPGFNQPPILEQGSICPNCGTYDMEPFSNDKNVKKCRKCNHKIHLRGKFKYNDISELEKMSTY
ncbi:cold shock domain-containing protein [Caldifermentibacillus hisashii]|jgi:cold shock CspA family protein/Fe-S-cluster formation regulator IscX/YfhJ|uniref:cold-shock protein n=1 Tax=Caldifermentibacillus hisashii TaxID=996558 RepID=UPI0031FDD129